MNMCVNCSFGEHDRCRPGMLFCECNKSGHPKRRKLKHHASTPTAGTRTKAAK